jgi:hypothetical protein
MDWKAKIRESLAGERNVLDDDIIEELAAHASNAYEALRADGCDAAGARQQTLRLIESWRREAPHLRRRPRRPFTIEPPPVESLRFAGLMNDVRWRSGPSSSAGLAALPFSPWRLASAS